MTRTMLARKAVIMLGVIVAAAAGVASRAEAKPIKLHNFQAAIVVIGQTDFTSGDSGLGPGSFFDAYGDPLFAGGILFVPDWLNARVLGFNHIPKTNGASADFVLGQPTLNDNSEGTAANEFGGPINPVSTGGRLIVDDYSDNRVLIWNTIPKTTQAPADLVVGQTGFNLQAHGCGPTQLFEPETIWAAHGKLVVADSANNRILIWKTIPTANGVAPDLVLGQGDFSTCVKNNDGGGISGSTPTSASLSFPAAIWTDGKRLVVNDYDNFRVLIWKKFPTSNFQPADLVLGQPDFTSSFSNNDGTGKTGPPTAQNLGGPFDGLYSNGTQLFVADDGDHRVLIWNKFPTHNFQPANRVLGQPDFTCRAENNDGSGTCKNGSPSAQGLSFPEGVVQVGNRLIVNDNGNNRYLVYKGK